MDLAVYISELLGQQGEVNVPGIGCFAQVRVNGYFNEQENKFYPPGHEVSFQPQSKDDSQLAMYIAGKKNISLASSKYFIDKYVIGIKQQVESQKVEISGLGYLYADNSALTFKANSSRENDPAFFGFPPLKVPSPIEQSELSTPPVREEVRPVVEDTPAKDVPEEIIIDVPARLEENHIPQELEQEEYLDDEPEARQGVSGWVIVLLIVIGVILALTGIYIYKPSLFDQFLPKKQTQTVIVHTANPDTVVKAVATKDTVAKISPAENKTPAPVAVPQQPSITPADTNTRVHYEILGGAFGKLSDAEATIKNYKGMGFDARILDVPGKKHKVTLGTYYTYTDAAVAKKQLLSTGKITEKDVTIQPFKPRKK